jgi:hypothetical protein
MNPEWQQGPSWLEENDGRGVDDADLDFETPLQTTDEVERQGYGDYVDSVLEDGTAFIQIAKNMFVVNGWDPKARRSKVFFIYLRKEG